jgi:hypothetical protein
VGGEEPRRPQTESTQTEAPLSPLGETPTGRGREYLDRLTPIRRAAQWVISSIILAELWNYLILMYNSFDERRLVGLGALSRVAEKLA